MVKTDSITTQEAIGRHKTATGGQRESRRPSVAVLCFPIASSVVIESVVTIRASLSRSSRAGIVQHSIRP